MNPQDQMLLQAICRACARLYRRDLLAASDGNVSVRLSNGRIAMTPSGVSKADLEPDALALLDETGRCLSGRASSERPMHLAIYRACPEARAIAHAHPPTAIAWTLARPDLAWLPADALPEVVLAAGAIPIVPYAQPGSDAMGDALRPWLPAHRLLLLSRHGAVAWGEDLDEVVGGLERVEHVAKILLAAHTLGGISSLSSDEMASLRALRASLGPRLR